MSGTGTSLVSGLSGLSLMARAYVDGHLSIDEFEDWFRDHARGMFAEDEEVRCLCLAIDSALSEMRDGTMTEFEFRQETATALRAFGESEEESGILVLNPQESEAFANAVLNPAAPGPVLMAAGKYYMEYRGDNAPRTTPEA